MGHVHCSRMDWFCVGHSVLSFVCDRQENRQMTGFGDIIVWFYWTSGN